MDMMIDQQVALNEALVPHARRLRIGRSNFRLLSDISSKESTLQLVYDVLRQYPFFKAFLVTADVSEIYMQEFWATSTVHHHSIRDDQMFTTIKLVSRHQNTQQFGAMLPIVLTNAEIMNFEAYKEYYAVATGATPPKTKASVQKTKSSSDTTVTPPPTAAAGTRFDDDQASNKEWEEFIHPSLSTYEEEETRDEESFDPIPKTPENTDDKGNGEENLGLSVGREEGQNKEDDADELYRDVNINLEGRGLQMGIESIFETTSQMDVQPPTTMAPLPFSEPTLTPSTIATITTVQQAPTPPTTALSTLLQDLPNFGSYMDQRMNEAVKVAIQIQSDRLHDEAQAENEEFLKTIDENMQKIIKEQVKEHVKVQVSKILPKIEPTMNEQLEAEVLTWSSNSSKTSYTVATDLSEMELKKILIEKMEGNKSIQRSNEKRNLYKALVEAYESDKIILDTYGDTVTLKRRHDDDADRDEEPSAESDWGSKRRREEKEPESASAPKKKATRSAGKSTKGSKSQQTSSSEFATAEEPMQTTHEMEKPSHPEFESGADDQPMAEPSQHPEWFSQQKKPPTQDPFLMNRLKVDTLTPKLLAGPTYELMKGSCKSLVELKFFLEEVYKATTDQLDWINPEGQQYPHNLLKPLPLIPNSQGRRVIPFDHFINNDLEYLCRGASSRKYTTSITKTKAADYGHIKWIEDLLYGFAVNRESARDVYSKRRIIAVTELKIVKWHNHKHLDWIMLTNLTVEERFAYNVSLKFFTRSIVIKRRVEDLQLGVKSYQKKLNLTRPDTYRSDLKRKEAYIAYSNPRGFIYQNKDKQNKLMRIAELHKFNDETLTDVCNALDDRLKEQTDGEAMINWIKNGDQPLPRVTQVSISGTTSTEQPPLKDKSMWSDQEKRIQEIDHLWDALARHMLGSEYGEQDRKAAVLYEYETFKATERELFFDIYIQYLQVINDLKKCGYSKDNCELNFKFLNNLQLEWKQYATMIRQNKNLMDINIDALYNILKQNQGEVNDAMGSKKKTVVVTSDPLALIAEKTNVSRSKEKVVVSSDSKGSEADDFSELKKIAALLEKAFNRIKFYSKPTNNNLRTSYSSQSANKKQEFVKTDTKKVEKKDDEKKRDMSRVICYNCKKAKVKDYGYYKTKMLLAKKDKDEKVLLVEDQAWM
nr:hypothetical protein [Tanacetum cinerariifolium]